MSFLKTLAENGPYARRRCAAMRRVGDQAQPSPPSSGETPMTSGSRYPNNSHPFHINRKRAQLSSKLFSSNFLLCLVLLGTILGHHARHTLMFSCAYFDFKCPRLSGKANLSTILCVFLRWRGIRR